MHGGIEFEFITVLALRIVLVQHSVTADQGNMFPGFEINQADQIPGEIRSYSHTADVASRPQAPLLGYLPLPPHTKKRVGIVYALVDIRQGPGKSSSPFIDV